jgi:hypothetical protein
VAKLMLFVQGRDPLTQIPILDAHQRQYAFINPKDNHAFLTEEFLQSLQAMPDRQRRRFYEGIYQAEIDGALWTFETIEHARCLPEDVPRDLKRVVVSVDPSGTRGDEDQRSDNIGIVAVGLGRPRRRLRRSSDTCRRCSRQAGGIVPDRPADARGRHLGGAQIVRQAQRLGVSFSSRISRAG